MKHEPCALLCDAKSPLDFVRANAIFAVGDHPNGGEPFVKTKRAVFKDGAYFGAELALGVLLFAFPRAARGNVAHVLAPACRAANALWPTKLDHRGMSYLRISKMLDRFG